MGGWIGVYWRVDCLRIPRPVAVHTHTYVYGRATSSLKQYTFSRFQSPLAPAPCRRPPSLSFSGFVPLLNLL